MESKLDIFIKIGTFVIAILALFDIHPFSMIKDTGSMEEKVSTLISDVADINDDIDRLSEKMDTTQSKVDQLWGSLSNELTSNRSFSSSVYREYRNLDSPFQDKEDSLSGSTVIGTDNNTGDERSVSDVAGQPLLISCVEDGTTDYFLGQINEDGEWDGHCIYNSYENGRLTFISEAQYEDGKLISYEQVFTYVTTNRETEVWAVSDRTVGENDVRSGETYYYYRTEEFTQQFEPDDVTESDILTVDDFRNYLEEQNAATECYYYGQSYDGFFNDDTDRAYMVKYYENGDVRALYCGRFKDGQFDDQTGNGWLITFSVEDDCYYLYRDTFTNGLPDHDEEPTELTESLLNSLLEDREISSSLEGLR